MQLARLVFEFCLLSFAAGAALPLAPPKQYPPPSPGGQCATSQGSANRQTAKALYFISNEPSGNAVIALDLGPNGVPARGAAHRTNGNGGIGIDAMTGAPALTDALFSQSALRVGDDFLFAVNAGSNTLSMFSIDPESPTTLSMVGEPVDTQGEFPVSVTYSSLLKKACVANTGAVNNVACFDVDPVRGLAIDNNFAITSLGLNQTTPPRGPPSTVSHIFFSPDSSGLHVTVKGPNFGTGSLVSFACDSEGCGQAMPNTPNGTAVLFGSVFTDQQTLLATDASFGAATLGVGAGAPMVKSTTRIEGQKATCWAAFSPKTKTVFVTDVGVNRVVEIDPSDGSIASSLQLKNGNPGNIDIAVGGDLVYALSPVNGSASVAVMDASGGKGTLREVTKFNVAGMGKVGPASMGMQVYLSG